MITQDGLRACPEDSRARAEQEQVARYGRRYLQYREQYEAAGRFAYEPPFPLYLMLEQSYHCNLRCPMCIQGLPERSQFAPAEQRMSRELFDRIVLEGEEHGCPSMAMHVNDEPLLVADLPARIALTREHGFMEVFVTTNGLLFTAARARAVVEAGATHILFSLDAATPETYAKVRVGGQFQKALEALHTVRAARSAAGSALPILRASFVQNRHNEHEIEQFRETFAPLVDYVEIQGFSSYYDKTDDLIPTGARHVSDFSCNEPWRKLIVRANGDVLPCCTFYGYEIVLGNLRDRTLKGLFSCDAMREMRREFAAGIYGGGACRSCSRSFYQPVAQPGPASGAGSQLAPAGGS